MNPDDYRQEPPQPRKVSLELAQSLAAQLFHTPAKCGRLIAEEMDKLEQITTAEAGDTELVSRLPEALRLQFEQLKDAPATLGDVATIYLRSRHIDALLPENAGAEQEYQVNLPIMRFGEKVLLDLDLEAQLRRDYGLLCSGLLKLRDKEPLSDDELAVLKNGDHLFRWIERSWESLKAESESDRIAAEMRPNEFHLTARQGKKYMRDWSKEALQNGEISPERNKLIWLAARREFPPTPEEIAKLREYLFSKQAEEIPVIEETLGDVTTIRQTLTAIATALGRSEERELGGV